MRSVRPVFITGHSRSGTSLTAGLFAAHGVWFGPCVQPRGINQKGFFESVFVKDCIKGKEFKDFQNRWDSWMAEQKAESLWGVKTGPEYYRLFKPYNPVVVCTSRPLGGILNSRKRAGFKKDWAAIRKASKWIKRLPESTVVVRPDEIVAGDFSSFEPALHALGLELDKAAAMEWVDPSIWNVEQGA